MRKDNRVGEPAGMGAVRSASAALRRRALPAVTGAMIAILATAAPAVRAQASIDSEPTGLRLVLSPFVGGARWADPGAITHLAPNDLRRWADANDGIHFGIRAGLAFNRWIGIEGTYGVSPHGSDTDDARVNHTGADAVLSLPLWRRITPYVLGGWAQLEFDSDRDPLQSLNGWEYGGGVRIGLSRLFSLRLDARDVVVEEDVNSSWQHSQIYTAGLQFAFGGAVPDSDRDGVRDHLDRCPDTPSGAVVDAAGCPGDSDADGVYDGLDQCSGTPRGARVDARGCPRDGDGDGVQDGIDECPDTPSGVPVDRRGCPLELDGDGDGVLDASDECPGTPTGTRVDARGCPLPVREKETQLRESGLVRLNVHFESGKARLQPESLPVLDEVGEILSDWPQLRVEIGGHTDSTGKADFNRELSRARAQAVLEYLRSKFPALDASQYTTAGYGEDQPVADNRTRDGRAENRRVEFKVLNPEAMRE